MSLKIYFLFSFIFLGTHSFANEAHPAPETPAAHESKEVSKDDDTKVFQMGDSGSDIKIPSQLWNLIQGDKADQNLTFAPLTIRLQEKTKGVLVAPRLVIELPRGGGEVDLSKFVRNVQGTFSVFFEYEEIQETKEEQIYFVSRVKKRRLEDEIWGAGCNKFMDIKEYMTNKVLKEGLEVNTTRHRHLSVLGGSFIFSAKNLVTQVTFKDSTAPQFFCDDSSGNSKEVKE